MAARWQGTIAILLLIIISYVDRVNISVMILNPEFAANFHLNENRMLQGMLMTCFLLGYGLSALILTPLIESKLNYRQGLLSSVAIWALVCAVSPLLGSLLGMLIARIVLGVAEGPLFSLKTRFISDSFAADEVGKPNAVTALGVSLGLAAGFPLVTWLMAHVGWMGSFYALALLNLLLGGGLVWRFLPAPVVNERRARLGMITTLTLAWRTPLLGWILLVEIATLSYLWGSSAWLPAWLRDEHHFSLQATGLLAAVPFLLSLGSKFLGGVLLDKMRPEQAPVLFIIGGLLTALSVLALMLSHQQAMLALFMLAANVFWGLQGAAIPAVVQHHAPHEAVGSAYGIINGIGNICAAFIPLLMGMVMKSAGSVSSGFSVLVVSQLITLCAGGMLLLRMRRAAAVSV
ncbi:MULTISPECIES: MFS transporter [Klebsiella]|uniref:MFS transporter n=1 Tax=Klebsiella TaxID=570 RepID=UPI000DA3CCCE|nr:MFS transporter [Klebsiella oxytoca]MBZ7260696.1 MFS transporter [Klebsiella oxytoca]MBZ7711317.1 MFS transporter [Klebsiella oxytoca]CAF2842766.1 putative L-galactonate transporter [Klebsiella oxytoca]CAF2853972.1 putative L-galactonate transporter [Klebsiella oxytoca]CAH5433476.1 putative L-galactonate transporter [Klebsiella oxytoca]